MGAVATAVAGGKAHEAEGPEKDMREIDGEYYIAAGWTPCLKKTHELTREDCWTKAYGTTSLHVDDSTIRTCTGNTTLHQAKCYAKYDYPKLKKCVADASILDPPNECHKGLVYYPSGYKTQPYLTNAYGHSIFNRGRMLTAEKHIKDGHGHSILSDAGHLEFTDKEGKKVWYRAVSVGPSGKGSPADRWRDFIDRMGEKYCKDSPSYNPKNYFCSKTYCNEDLRKCPDIAMRVCNTQLSGDDKYHQACRDALDRKDMSLAERNAKSEYMRTQYVIHYDHHKDMVKYLTDTNASERDKTNSEKELKLLLRDSQHPDLSHDLAMDYDALWKAICANITPETPELLRAACSCHLSQKQLDDAHAARPDCLNSTCATSPYAYQPYQTVRTFKTGCVLNEDGIPICAGGASCPNVCSQNIIVEAGKISIIDNIHMIQRCFASEDNKTIRDLTEAELDASVGVGMTAYKIACTYLEIPIQFYPEHAVKKDIEENIIDYDYHGEIQKKLTIQITRYEFLLPIKIAVMKKLKETIMEKITAALGTIEDLYSINWSDETAQAEDLRNEYETKKQKAITGTSPLIPLVEEVEQLVKENEAPIATYETQRLQIINDANISMDNFLKDYPDYIDTIGLENNLVQIEESGKSIRDLETILDIMKDVYANHIEYMQQQVTDEENENLIQTLKGVITLLVQEIDTSPHSHNQEYKNDWVKLNGDASDPTRQIGDVDIIIRLQDFRSSLDAFITTKKRNLTMFDPTVGDATDAELMEDETADDGEAEIIISDIPLEESTEVKVSRIKQAVKPIVPEQSKKKTNFILIIIIAIVGALIGIIGIAIVVWWFRRSRL